MAITISKEDISQIPFGLLPMNLRVLTCSSVDIRPVIYSVDNRTPNFFRVTDINCVGKCDNPKCLLKNITAV